MTKTIAITGAGGFIGRHLTAHLLDEGYKVHALGRSAVSFGEVDKRAKTFETSYQDAHLLKALDGCSDLIHLAGRRLTHDDDPHFVAPFATANLTTLDALLRACKETGVSKVINMSSIGVYSLAMQTPWQEDDHPLPATAYGVGKLSAEQAADFWSRMTEIPVVHFRLAQCFGHGERETGILMKLVAQARAKKTLKVTNSGTFRLDQVYIDDVVKAFSAALAMNAMGAINIGAGRDFSVMEIAETINRAFDNEGNLVVDGDPSKRDVERYMSIEKAEALLSWRPDYSLEKALTKMASMNA